MDLQGKRKGKSKFFDDSVCQDEVTKGFYKTKRNNSNCSVLSYDSLSELDSSDNESFSQTKHSLKGTSKWELFGKRHPLAQPKEDFVIPHRNPSCLLYTSPSPRDLSTSRMPSSA